MNFLGMIPEAGAKVKGLSTQDCKFLVARLLNHGEGGLRGPHNL